MLEAIKKYLGLVWMALAIVAAYYCIGVFGWPKITSGLQEDNVFGWIILLVLTPIIVGGLFMFGYFAFTNEYKKEE
ncbi:DUF6814 family protein [Polluticaenibacter yanchengensis]|uniref:DUF997 family protein n=1 Tax=Polluticaenibacter yanchengensis TaxID=3014562 RepID=A0ABT4UJA4_9BACT|nr:hypothetical protein [Chitinophagaceae bacterium LY-5]